MQPTRSKEEEEEVEEVEDRQQQYGKEITNQLASMNGGIMKMLLNDSFCQIYRCFFARRAEIDRHLGPPYKFT